MRTSLVGSILEIIWEGNPTGPP